MKNFKTIALALAAAMALSALLGAGGASATALYKYTTPKENDTLGIGTVVELSLKPETSLVLTETSLFNLTTCAGGSLKFALEGDGVLAPSKGKISAMSFSSCSHTTHPFANADGTFGEIEIQNTPETTNGTIISRHTRFTVVSTFFGVTCGGDTGKGMVIGTFTGATSSVGHATVDINAVVPMGLCGDAYLTATYTVTSPTGLIAEPI